MACYTARAARTNLLPGYLSPVAKPSPRLSLRPTRVIIKRQVQRAPRKARMEVSATWKPSSWLPPEWLRRKDCSIPRRSRRLLHLVWLFLLPPQAALKRSRGYVIAKDDLNFQGQRRCQEPDFKTGLGICDRHKLLLSAEARAQKLGRQRQGPKIQKIEHNFSFVL